MRNQILIGFILVMTAVFFIFGVNTYRSVSGLLKTSAAKHIQQTAVQANGRLDALIGQMDNWTAQIMTNPYVQQLLLAEVAGQRAGFSERQDLMQIVSNFQTYSTGVNRVELYTLGYHRLFPLDETSLVERVPLNWIEKADELKGRLLWLGIDPRDPQSVLAIRRISLVDRWFSPGGYLLVSMDRSYFDVRETLAENELVETVILSDPEGIPIASNLDSPPPIRGLLGSNSQTVTVQDQEYMMIQQTSEETGWTLIILTPIREVTKGISVLRDAIMASGIIGFVLFILLSYLLSGFITKPILRLIKTMRNARDGILKPNTIRTHTMELQELNNTYNQMVDNINELIKLVYEKELLQSQTELKALQAQINPHFLYNTLEAFYWSLSDKGEEELADLVIAMSHIFRYVITGSGRQEWVTVQDELKHIERYLLIMKMRLGERLTWSIECPATCEKVPIPKLLIQPLVENAIVHGIEGRVGGGNIRVRIIRPTDAERIKVYVVDDGPGMDESSLQELRLSLKAGTPVASKGTGIGIRNVARRLELYYGADAGELDVYSAQDIGTTVHFEIPIKGA